MSHTYYITRGSWFVDRDFWRACAPSGRRYVVVTAMNGRQRGKTLRVRSGR